MPKSTKVTIGTFFSFKILIIIMAKELQLQLQKWLFYLICSSCVHLYQFMDSAEKSSKRCKFDKVFCPHCSRAVSKSTCNWYLHYSKYYIKSTKTWQVDFDFDEATNAIDIDCQVEDFPTV